MKLQGFRTYVFHGNTDLFYDRGLVMRELRFDHLSLKEQLVIQHLPTNAEGVRDANLLRYAPKALQAESRACIFVITLDMHIPFG